MSQRDYSYRSAEQYPCPICGKKDYIWGKTGQEPRFYAEESGSVAIFLSQGKRIRARKCKNCGNLQLFVQE